METVCIAAYVSGVVQGVGFRYCTKLKAQQLDLCGYVCNLDDGRVEAVAEGEVNAVEQLIAWLKAGGPATAKVSRVDIEPWPHQGYMQFEIKRGSY